jgi:hypothetical protein
MKYIKQILLTIFYVIVLSFILFLVNLALGWLIEHFVSPLFEWFYKINLIWKIFLLLFGGLIFISLVLNLFRLLTSFVGILLNNIFPYNKAIRIISIIMCTLNIIESESQLWSFLRPDFWIICMWLILSFFIVQINYIFYFRNLKTNYE